MFHKTTITVTVLSEGPFEFSNLSDVHYAITSGDCSGEFTEVSEVVDGPTMAKLLEAQGSDPGFFQLPEDDSDENEEEKEGFR